MKRFTLASAVALALTVGVADWSTKEGAAQAVQIDQVSIAGVVVNTDGQRPEAGVWVIAETSSLPTHFRRIVVTDDQGRFVVPDLPDGAYEVWVRGYGLRDSAPRPASRGQQLTLQVADAATQQAAAQIYPANYWLSMYEPPPAETLPDQFTSQEHWIAEMKLGCMLCHQLGARPTRFRTSPEAWDTAFRRTNRMPETAAVLGSEVLLNSLAEWGSRIAAGEVPPAPTQTGRGGAEHRGDAVGMGAKGFIHPRRDLDRQAQSHVVSLREGLGRRPRTGLLVGTRPEDAHGVLVQGPNQGWV